MAVERWSPFTRSVERWDPFRDLSEIQAEMNRLLAELPGVNEKEIQVSMTGDLLTIQGAAPQDRRAVI